MHVCVCTSPLVPLSTSHCCTSSSRAALRQQFCTRLHRREVHVSQYSHTYSKRSAFTQTYTPFPIQLLFFQNSIQLSGWSFPASPDPQHRSLPLSPWSWSVNLALKAACYHWDCWWLSLGLKYDLKRPPKDKKLIKQMQTQGIICWKKISKGAPATVRVQPEWNTSIS